MLRSHIADCVPPIEPDVRFCDSWRSGGEKTHSRHESLETGNMFGGVRGYPGVTGGPVGPGGPWRKVLCVEKFCRTARNVSHSGRNGGVRGVWRDWRVPVRAKRVVRRRMRDEKEASWDDVGRWQHPRSRQAEGAERGVLSRVYIMLGSHIADCVPRKSRKAMILFREASWAKIGRTVAGSGAGPVRQENRIHRGMYGGWNASTVTFPARHARQTTPF